MSMKIGHFEIISELAKSPTGAVYKANDPETGQTVALKAIQLSAYGDSAVALEKALVEEVESTKALSSPNITTISGAGEIEGQFCAAMEYVQGNSIGTMLARKEGFSIWDLLDIGRQLCAALDHASSHRAVHYSLEPAKIMCGWDGTVKILSFGVSSVGNFASQVTEGLPIILHYMSPEQVQGQPIDARSNLYSLGAMFYEMVTDRKAFDGDGIPAVQQSIVESIPVPPIQLNPKVHPLLSNLILKALAKDPAERYQSGRDLLEDLEKCKESKPVAGKKAEPAKSVAPGVAPGALKTPAQSPARPAAVASGAKPPAQSSSVAPAAPKPTPNRVTSAPVAKAAPEPPPLPAPPQSSTPALSPNVAAPPAAPKAVAAAAAAGSASHSSASSEPLELDLSNQFITASVKATLAASEQPSSQMSAAAVETFEPQIEPKIVEPQVLEPYIAQPQIVEPQIIEPNVIEPQFIEPQTPEPQAAPRAPKIAVDPMMAEGAQASRGTSFSEISELPPLKEDYVAPPPYTPPLPSSLSTLSAQAPAARTATTFSGSRAREEEKPKANTREAAEKAIQEIKSVPAKLMLYALGGAAAIILVIGIAITVYIHRQNSDDDANAGRTAAVTTAPEMTESASKSSPDETASRPREIMERSAPERSTAREHNSKKKAAPVAAPTIIPGTLAVDSTPQGAQVQVDGKGDPSWVTPFALTNLDPGAHSVTVSKPGYTSATQTVQVTSGNRASTVLRLVQLVATLIVSSNPAGANVYVDGRDMGTKTPAQISVGQGSHVVLVRKNGYLDETMNGQFVLGQTFNFSPALRPLGNVDDIRTVGKMARIFGGKSALPGQAIVTIRTEPKGAQVSINQHIMDKNSPLEAALDPGNYVIDIALTGYAPVHKVITVDKSAKLVVDEVLQPQ